MGALTSGLLPVSKANGHQLLGSASPESRFTEVELFLGTGKWGEPSPPSPFWDTLIASVHPELLEELTKVLWGLRPIHPQLRPILLPPPPIPSGDPNAPAAVVDTTQPGPDCVPKMQVWTL